MRVVSMYFYVDRMQASLCIYLGYNSLIDMHSFYILYLFCNKLMSVKFVRTLKIEAVHLFERFFIHIQGDLGEICNTLGNDSMCDSKQKKFT